LISAASASLKELQLVPSIDVSGLIAIGSKGYIPNPDLIVSGWID